MIIIIYSVRPIFTNPVDWLKTHSNGVKLKALKFSMGGLCPPPPCTSSPRSGFGETGSGLLGKMNKGENGLPPS